jgi:hypothetical protein
MKYSPLAVTDKLYGTSSIFGFFEAAQSLIIGERSEETWSGKGDRGNLSSSLATPVVWSF